MNKKTESGNKAPTKPASRGPSEKELMEIRALYAQADALLASLPEGATEDEAAQQDADENSETCPVASSAQARSMDNDPEQGDPR